MTSHFQDGGHDVISHRKVLPSGECTRGRCCICSQQSNSVYSSWSIIHSRLLINILHSFTLTYTTEPDSN